MKKNKILHSAKMVKFWKSALYTLLLILGIMLFYFFKALYKSRSKSEVLERYDQLDYRAIEKGKQ